MLAIKRNKILNKKKSLILACLIFAGCDSSVSQFVSMESILQFPNDFNNQTIQTYGFLQVKSSPKLFKNLNDAFYTKESSVIGFENIENRQLAFFDNCADQYLYITGTLKYEKKNNVSFISLKRVSTDPTLTTHNPKQCHYIFEEKKP